ncbi:MAG: adenylosuccinate lyase [Oscillatoriales cyanobacterium]|nr:MAG: adenylosuccinate lyase [Oscillatoriales cyanobacterium]
MIDRYTLPEMGNIWTETAKLKTWLQVEIAVCEAQAELGYIPAAAVEEIKAKANFDPKRVLEIEAEVRHDMIAFLTNVNEYVGDAGRYIHLGLTSSDVLDTALALQLVASVNILLERVEDLSQAIRYQAQQHRNTVMVGRSHGIHAEPITFGFKLAGWLAEVFRNRARLVNLRSSIAVGKISGAVGTYANIDPRIEAIACQNLGLEPDTASTQVISRDRHAEYVQRSERLTGMARIVRANAVAALENVALWHERDISHSSVERMILPDSSTVTHFMLVETTDLVKHLLVYPENMKQNMNLYGGVIFSQRVMLALVEKGTSREDAYKIVQSCAHEAWNKTGGNFYNLIAKDERVAAKMTSKEIDDCFDPQYQLRHLDLVYQRLGI